MENLADCGTEVCPSARTKARARTPVFLLDIRLRISSLLLVTMFKSCKKSGSVEGRRVDETEATEQDLGYKEIKLTFPKKSNDEICFNNRTKDDLPASIKGIAEWKVRQDFRQLAYLLGDETQVQAIEYINDEWYNIFWERASNNFSVARIDKILDPTKQGLGTRFTPFGIQEPAASDDIVETISEADEPSEHSPEDTPVVDRTQVKIFNELAERLAETTLHAPQTTEMSTTVTQTIAHTSAEGGGLFHVGGPSGEGDLGGGWPSDKGKQPEEPPDRGEPSEQRGPPGGPPGPLGPVGAWDHYAAPNRVDYGGTGGWAGSVPFVFDGD